MNKLRLTAQIIALATLWHSAIVASAQIAGLNSNAQSDVRSLGLYVTLARLSQVTEQGLNAIPQGALVSLVEDSSGKKYAIFRNTRVPVDNPALLSNDPQKIAAATASKNTQSAGTQITNAPGAMVNDRGGGNPEARSDESIRLDASGKVVSRSKTTVITDGSGNSTTITQDGGGMTPERAARLAVAREKLTQHRQAIADLKSKKSMGGIVTGYEGKLKQMTDLLLRMEAEYARMSTEYGR
jgi:hypothetical protein